MPSGPAVDRATARAREILRDVRGGSQFAGHVDEVSHVICLIGPDRSATVRRPLPLRVQHQQASLALRGAVRRRRHRVGNQAVPILDQEVAQIRQPRFGAGRLAIQPRIRVGFRGMRVVRSLLPAEVAPIPIRVAILPLKALLARPGFDQRAVDGEMFVRHQARRPLHHALKETARDRLIQEPVAILGEDRRRSDRLVHVHPDEPAKQQVVVQLLINRRSLRIE